MKSVLKKLYKSLIVVLLFVTIFPLSLNAKGTALVHDQHAGFVSLPTEGALSGNYILNSINLQLTGDLTIAEGTSVAICMNGNILDLNGYSIINKGTLIISDCKEDVLYLNPVFGTDSKPIAGAWGLDGVDTNFNLVGGVITDSSNSVNSSNRAITNKENSNLKLENINFAGFNKNGIIQNAGILNIENCKFIGNKSTQKGCTILSFGVGVEVNIKDSEFAYNLSESDQESTDSYGGAIYLTSNAKIENSKIHDNKADIGGGIYITNGNELVLKNGTEITNNIATKEGGGVYLAPVTTFTCLAKGTQITMADDSLKNIEDITEDDYVKTFDHETGKLTSSRVYLAYKDDTQCKPFTLNFSNNIQLKIAGLHDLLEKETLKYVTITEENVEEYIGKYFYNANDNRWEELLSVSYDNEQCDYYSIYTVNNQNSIANNMLTLPDDVDYLLNIFDMNSDLIFDKAKMEADIAKYGLYQYEDCSSYLTRQEYDERNTKYLNIVVGKGFKTFEYLLNLAIETSEFTDNQENTLFASIVEFVYPKIVSAKSIDNTTLTIESIGSEDKGVIIKNNIANEKTNNVHLEEETLIDFVGNLNVEKIDIGVNHKLVSNVAISYSNDNDYNKGFKSDIEGLIVIYNNDKELELVEAPKEVEEPKSEPVDTTCEAVIGKDWTWDEELGVCKLKGYRIVNTSTN